MQMLKLWKYLKCGRHKNMKKNSWMWLHKILKSLHPKATSNGKTPGNTRWNICNDHIKQRLNIQNI